MVISVCVCTYNRRELLEHCLKSLSELVDPRPRYEIEIIVIDNNSNDGTGTLVKSLIPHFPFPLHYVYEGVQGLSVARNTAIEVAGGEYLAFLDDECFVPTDWLDIAFGNIVLFNPK